MRFGRISHLRRASPAALLALICLLAQNASADRLPLIGSGTTGTARPGSVTPSNGLIVSVDPVTVLCFQSATFDGLEGGDNPGTNYDGVVKNGGLGFAERFEGQTLGANGDFDAVTGTPTGPLHLQVGAPGQNLDVFSYVTNVLAGLGNVGFPELDAIGEGSIAICFPSPQSGVSFDLVGGNGGTATLAFYRADGTLIDSVVISGLADLRYAFATANGQRSIAGILIQSTDASGVGIDNVCHDGGFTDARASTWGQIKSLYR